MAAASSFFVTSSTEAAVAATAAASAAEDPLGSGEVDVVVSSGEEGLELSRITLEYEKPSLRRDWFAAGLGRRASSCVDVAVVEGVVSPAAASAAFVAGAEGVGDPPAELGLGASVSFFASSSRSFTNFSSTAFSRAWLSIGFAAPKGFEAPRFLIDSSLARPLSPRSALSFSSRAARSASSLASIARSRAAISTGAAAPNGLGLVEGVGGTDESEAVEAVEDRGASSSLRRVSCGEWASEAGAEKER
jgi:hypothetical protein